MSDAMQVDGLEPTTLPQQGNPSHSPALSPDALAGPSEKGGKQAVRAHDQTNQFDLLTRSNCI